MTSAQLSPTGRFEKILLATDLSEFSEGAVREGLALAAKCGGQVYAMSVVQTNPEYESLAPDLLQAEERETLAGLEQVRERAAEEGVACEVVLRHGDQIYHEIVSEAEVRQVDLIVMGRRGRSGLMRLMMGSETAKVIGHARCSVLVVPRAARLAGNRLLLATDGSRYSDNAATAAMRLAKTCPAEVTVVSVAPEGDTGKAWADAEANVERVLGFLREEGVAGRGQVLTGRPDVAIVEAARTEGADLIVVGSHGRTGLERLLVGSVSERVIGHTECAVLVVKA
jgi:nucleotide-binding universal stress UspA family protein